MDRKEKLAFAKQQIAEIWKCDPAAFDLEKNVFLASKDTFFECITFGSNAVLRADEAILDWCFESFLSVPARDIMDGERLYQIEDKLRCFGKKLSGEHVGYLHLFPEKTVCKPKGHSPGGYTYRLFVGKEMEELYSLQGFENAFSTERERNVLSIAAYDGETIAAIAGADDYLHSLWQIGIDTLPAYRKRGLGAFLVKEIACEIERRQKVAYYNT